MRQTKVLQRVILAITGFTVAFGADGTAADGGLSPLRLDPEQAVAIALRSHPRLAEVRAREDQNRAQRRQALAEVFPQVEAKAQTVRRRDPGLLNTPNFEDLASSPGFDPSFLKPIPTTGYEYAVTLDQTLYGGGRVVTGLTALDRELQRQRLERHATELEIARAALVACYDLALAGARVDVLDAERASRERQVQQAHDLLEVGKGTRLQWLQARAGLAGLKPREIAARENRNAARVGLNVALGRPPLAPVDVMPGLLESAQLEPLPPVAELLDRLSLRPDLQALEMQRQVLSLQQRISRAEARPSLRFSGSLGISTIDPANLTDSEFSSWDAGIYLEWSLYDGARRRARIEELAAAEREVLHRRETLESQLAERLVRAVADYRRAREAAEAAAAAVEQAQEAHRVAEEEYRWGAATMLQVLEAERALTEARLSLLEARHDGLVAGAIIAELTDRPPARPAAGVAP